MSDLTMPTQTTPDVQIPFPENAEGVAVLNSHIAAAAKAAAAAAAAVEISARSYNWTKEESKWCGDETHWRAAWWHEMTEQIEYLTQQCRHLRLDHQQHLDQKDFEIKDLKQTITDQETKIKEMAAFLCKRA